MEKTRITESELVLPSLFLMSATGSICTTDLINNLAQILKPQGKDAEIIENRKDTYFSQKVRNLKSHNTLTRTGYADYKEGRFYITDKGRQLIDNNKANIQYVLSASFNYDDIRMSFGKIYKSRNAIVVPYEELIEEGSCNFVFTKTYKRSSKLRNIAIEHFSKNGIITCDCCGFEFKSFYGEKFGTPCIEIHHLKPIFQYSSMSIKQTINDALENLLPVCPNCHRVIHKNRITRDMIPGFKKQISLCSPISHL